MKTSDKVWVRLTERGTARFEELALEVEKNFGSGIANTWRSSFQSTDGWHSFSLGCLMKYFGPVCDNGQMALFKNNEVHLTRPQ